MKPKSFLALLAALLPVIASAHPGHDGDHDFGWDFTGGLTHPLFGWDHLLAMIAVGLWASRLGGRAQWQIPLTFLVTLVVGASAARLGLTLPGVEPFIAASLIGLGALIALATSLRTSVAAAIIALFAFAHGFAHGAEMPASSGWTYGAGFVLASALLVSGGLTLGRALPKGSVKVFGAATTIAGVYTLLA